MHFRVKKHFEEYLRNSVKKARRNCCTKLAFQTQFLVGLTA
jgi:hypothetical protein